MKLTPSVPSRTAVRRAGSTLRRHFNGEASEEERVAELMVLRAYRHAFQEPMECVGSELQRILYQAHIEGK